MLLFQNTGTTFLKWKSKRGQKGAENDKNNTNNCAWGEYANKSIPRTGYAQKSRFVSSKNTFIVKRPTNTPVGGVPPQAP
jgi:hypothetical protein